MTSKQFRNGRYHNTSGLGPDLDGPTLRIMHEFFFGGAKRRPRITIPVLDPTETWRLPPASGLRVSWFGHSAFLLELDGARILADPMFGERASPVPFLGPRRFHRVPVTVDQLPRLDAILMSHDHHDHLNPESVRALGRLDVPWITSLGVGRQLERFGVAGARVTELDWWASHEVGGLTITATPAQHFSGRGLTDRNRTLWSSWVFASPRRRVFFSGDTGLTDELAEIGRRYGRFELCLLEIGAWHPAWGSIHLGPEQALRAFAMLGGGTLMPLHWATFDLALHAWDEPIETLSRLAAQQGVRVVTPRIGEPIEPASAMTTAWWRG